MQVGFSSPAEFSAMIDFVTAKRLRPLVHQVYLLAEIKTAVGLIFVAALYWSFAVRDDARGSIAWVLVMAGRVHRFLITAYRCNVRVRASACTTTGRG